MKKELPLIKLWLMHQQSLLFALHSPLYNFGSLGSYINSLCCLPSIHPCTALVHSSTVCCLPWIHLFLQDSSACRLLKEEELFTVSFLWDCSVAHNVVWCSFLTGSKSWSQGWVPCNPASDHSLLHLPWQILWESPSIGSWRHGHRWGWSHQGHNYSRRGRPEAD